MLGTVTKTNNPRPKGLHCDPGHWAAPSLLEISRICWGYRLLGSAGKPTLYPQICHQEPHGIWLDDWWQPPRVLLPDFWRPAGLGGRGTEPDSPGMWLPMYLMCISWRPTSVGAYLTVTVPSLLSTISGVAVFPEGMWTSPVGAHGDRTVTPPKTVPPGAEHRGTGDLHNKGSQTQEHSLLHKTPSSVTGSRDIPAFILFSCVSTKCSRQPTSKGSFELTAIRSLNRTWEDHVINQISKASSQKEAGIERRQGEVTLTQQTSVTMSHLEEWKSKKRQEKAGEEEADNLERYQHSGSPPIDNFWSFLQHASNKWTHSSETHINTQNILWSQGLMDQLPTARDAGFWTPGLGNRWNQLLSTVWIASKSQWGQEGFPNSAYRWFLLSWLQMEWPSRKA